MQLPFPIGDCNRQWDEAQPLTASLYIDKAGKMMQGMLETAIIKSRLLGEC